MTHRIGRRPLFLHSEINVAGTFGLRGSQREFFLFGDCKRYNGRCKSVLAEAGRAAAAGIGNLRPIYVRIDARTPGKTRGRESSCDYRKSICKHEGSRFRSPPRNPRVIPARQTSSGNAGMAQAHEAGRPHVIDHAGTVRTFSPLVVEDPRERNPQWRKEGGSVAGLAKADRAARRCRGDTYEKTRLESLHEAGESELILGGRDAFWLADYISADAR